MIQVAVTSGQAHSLTVIQVKEFFNQEIHTSSASSLAGLVSGISQGQQGFRCGDYALAARSGLDFFKELTERLLY